MLLVHVLDLGPLYLFRPHVLGNLLMIHSILLSPANGSVEPLTFPLEQEAQKWALSDLKPDYGHAHVDVAHKNLHSPIGASHRWSR